MNEGMTFQFPSLGIRHPEVINYHALGTAGVPSAPGGGKLFFCRAGTMKCFYILLCWVTGMVSFLMGFQQQLHELHVEEAGT